MEAGGAKAKTLDLILQRKVSIDTTKSFNYGLPERSNRVKARMESGLYATRHPK